MATEAINTALAEMVTAFRAEIDAPQARLYRRLLSGVPEDVISESADRLMVEPGRRFMPTPAEWMTTCSVVVEQRRQLAARQALALRESCDCSDGWRENEHGRMVRCSCHARAMALMQQVPEAIKALPSGDEAA